MRIEVTLVYSRYTKVHSYARFWLDLRRVGCLVSLYRMSDVGAVLEGTSTISGSSRTFNDCFHLLRYYGCDELQFIVSGRIL